MFNILQPAGWAPAKGYANGIEARGRQIFVAGMIGWNGQAQFETDDFVGQCRQALQNIVDTLACAGARAGGVRRALSRARARPQRPCEASMRSSSAACSASMRRSCSATWSMSRFRAMPRGSSPALRVIA